MNNTKTMGLLLDEWWEELSEEKREQAYIHLHVTGKDSLIQMKDDDLSYISWYPVAKRITVIGSIEYFYRKVEYIKNKKPTEIRFRCFSSLSEAKSELPHINYLLEELKFEKHTTTLQLSSDKHQPNEAYIFAFIDPECDLKCEIRQKLVDEITSDVISKIKDSLAKDVTKEIIDKLNNIKK